MISIVMPIYNREEMVGGTISSIIAQDYPNWELVVVDDGSADNSKKVVLDFSDSRIKYFYQTNQGASAARNHGVAESVGDWIVYVDSDDPVYPFFISTIVEEIENNPKAVFGLANHIRKIMLVDSSYNVLTEHAEIDTHGGDIVLQDLYHWNVKTTSTGMFHRRSLFDDNLSWDETLHYIEDLDLILQMGRRFPNEFLHIRKPLFTYRQMYGTKYGMCSNATYKNWGDTFEYLYQKHKDQPMLEGQTWWPDRPQKYARLHKLVEEGKAPPPMYKYFEDYFQKEAKE